MVRASAEDAPCMTPRVCQECPTERRPRSRPRTCSRDYISPLAWERLRIPLEELVEVDGEREVWAFLPNPLLPQPGH